MLKRFYIDNFKTHINTTLDLAPTNLLIGVNNSGKTNLCQALRLVGFSASMPLSKAVLLAVGDEWNLANVHLGKSTIDMRVDAVLNHEGEPCTFEYELSLKILEPMAAKEAGTRFVVGHEKLTVTTDGFNGASLIQNDDGRVRLLHETKKARGEEQFAQTSAPVDATMLSRLYDLKDYPRANLFKKYLASWLYYDLDSLQLRSPEAKILETVLNTDGSNLASVLFNLKSSQERLYRMLIDLTKKAIDPNLELLSFFRPAENQVFMFAEDSAGHRFGPMHMSSGTLRFMALAFILLSQQSHLDIGGPRLIMIEEPETGIFVGHLKALFSLIDTQGDNGQFIFTSHSPYFIDLFDSQLDGVMLAQRGEKNTQLIRPDAIRLRTLLDSMPLGEMHYRGILG